jgi:hypothetical protein
MKTINEAFPNGIEDIQHYAPDVPSNMNLESLTASFQNAYLRIANVIGETFLDSSLALEALKNMAQGALANYTIYEQAPFIFKGRDKVYKYQYEELKEKYITNAWSFINALINALDAGDSPEWKQSECYLSRQNLLFRNQNDFDTYYAIDKSAYFFSKIVFLIREESLKYTPKRITLEKLNEKPNLADKLKYRVAYRVMARAVIQFDISELPKSIRNDINHEFTKYPNAGENKKQLFDYLSGTADSYGDELEIELQKALKPITENSIDNPNSETKKYYFMR